MLQRLTIAALLTIAVSCEKPDRTVRYYKEVRFAKEGTPATSVTGMPGTIPTNVPPSAGSSMGDLPPEALGEKLPLAWDVPEGWEDLGPSGIRLSTLRVQGMDVTITSFPGDVGGDEANIRRWMDQLRQSSPDDAIKRLIEAPQTATTAGGFPLRLYDFAEVLPADAATSTLAGIIPVGEQTVFIKLTGEAAKLASVKNAFQEFCRSIRMRTEATY